MALTLLLLAVTASAFVSLESPSGRHSVLSLLTGALLSSSALWGPLGGTKLAVSAAFGLSPSLVLGQFLLLASGIVALLSYRGQPLLTFVLAAGGTVLISAQLPALIVAALELQSYAAYGVMALGGLRAGRAVAAGTYFLIGAGATASFVVGWALLTRGGDLALLQSPDRVFLGWLCSAAGLMAKLGCFPFVWWLPLAYSGASYGALGLVAVLPQFSLFVQGWSLCPVGPELVYLITCGSVAWASLLSASASHVRPLIALSGAAHVGYALSGVTFALEPILVYSGAYALIFAQLNAELVSSRPRHISDLRGYLSLFLLRGVSLQIALLNLAGIPPLLGFSAKALVLLGGICLVNSFVQPCLLVLLGVTGVVAYLRLTLASIGYPRSRHFSIEAASPVYTRGAGFLLASTLLAGGLTGELFFRRRGASFSSPPDRHRSSARQLPASRAVSRGT